MVRPGSKRIYLTILKFFLHLLIIGVASAGAMPVESAIYPISCVLCRILQIFWGIAAGIASLVIVLAGLKWIGNADDPSGRAQAKTTIVHAIVGLIIVTVAIEVVGWGVQNTVAGHWFDPGDWMPGADCAEFCT